MFNTLFYIPDEQQRRAVMRAMNRACPANKALLQEYVNLKNAVALAHGKPNFAEYNMYNSLYGSARAVAGLLKRSVQCYSPRLREYMAEAAEEKRRLGGDASLSVWDEEFFICRVVNRRRALGAAVGACERLTRRTWRTPSRWRAR